MENNSKNKISSKYGFQTPKVINKMISLKKVRSSGNMLKKSMECFPSLNTPMNMRKNKNQQFNKNNSINTQNHLNTLTEQNINKKVKKIKINFTFKSTKEKNQFNKNKFEINNKEAKKFEINSNEINKPKLSNSKSLNIIPLPSKKYTGSPKFLNTSGSPKILRKTNSLKSIKKGLENENNLKSGKEKEIINKINIKTSLRNSPSSAKPKLKNKSFEFLYLPHIVLDPLDVLNNQIEIILQKNEDEIKHLNELNYSQNIENLQKDYANNLYFLYQEKGKELIKIKNNYNKEIYNISYKDGNITEEELNKNTDIKINEIEKIFNEKKDKLKNEFHAKIEEIKNSFNILEQIELNKNLILEMKNKFSKIFKDKNMANKKGINFSLKDYKSIMKQSKIKISKLRNSSFHKK